MPDSKNEKKKILKSLGVPIDKLPDDKLNLLLDGIDDKSAKGKDIDIDLLLEKLNMGKHLQNILSTDNNDILNLLKQLGKLRNKNKNQ